MTFTPERKADTSTNALAENTATLTYTPDSGETVTLATATAQADGSFKLTYDTKKKELPIGEDLTLTVSYGGSGALNPVEETVTLSLDQAILMNVPTISGKFVYGETLTVNYTKQDDETVTVGNEPGGETIAGATGPEYKLTLEDIGNQIYVNVRATDEWHRGSMQSTNQDVVAKAPGSIKIACDSVTYGETVQPSVTSNTNTGVDVTYSYAGTDGTSYGPSSEAPQNAGTYTVTATVAETATHTAATSDPVTFTISKAGLTAPQNLSLTSTAPGKATATWEEVQNASGYTVRLYKDGEADGNPIITTGTSCEFSIAEAGSYTVKVKANGDSNHTDSTEAESNSLTFYNVTVNGSYAQTGGIDVYIEGATVSIDAGTRAGYTFDGWTSSDGVTFANAGSAQTSFTMPGKSVTVTESWVPNSSEVGDQEFVRYIVQHYKQNTDGSYRLEDAEYPIGEVGDTVTATARNYEGYTCNAEKSNASGTLTEIKSDADIVTLKLYYDLTVFTVTVETSGNGTASASPASATMGQTVTLTANAASGYHFVKWEIVSGDITLNGNTFTMPAGNVAVRAVFAEHTYGDWAQNSNDTHTRTCTACGVSQTENCSGGTATCTAQAVCAVCGRAYGEQDPDNHSKLTGIKAMPATHLTTGNIAYWHCEGCGKYYADALAAQEITLADTVLEKLPGHTADGSGWHRDENGHWQLCACGEHLDAAAHTFAWVTDKPATAAEAGSRHEQCTVCGYRKAAESIPPLAPEPDRGTDEHPEIGDAIADGTWGKTESAPADGETNTEKTVPATGDSSQPVLWIGLLAASGLGIAALLVLRRRKRQ